MGAAAWEEVFFKAPAEAQAVIEARAHSDSLAMFADGLDDDLDSLVNVQLSLASHRTNEVVRALTVFSAFFLPITFIVGVYGMNFDFMPELRSRFGYPAVLIFMLGIGVGMLIYFRRRGWVGRYREDAEADAPDETPS